MRSRRLRSQRQRDYLQVFGADSVYTTQIVAMSARPSPATLETKSAARSAASPSARDLASHADKLQITIDLPDAAPNTERIDVLAVITEDDLRRRSPSAVKTAVHVAPSSGRQKERAAPPSDVGAPSCRDSDKLQADGIGPPGRGRVAAGHQLPPGVRRRAAQIRTESWPPAHIARVDDLLSSSRRLSSLI
jgi:hypothetical protein